MSFGDVELTYHYCSVMGNGYRSTISQMRTKYLMYTNTWNKDRGYNVATKKRCFNKRGPLQVACMELELPGSNTVKVDVRYRTINLLEKLMSESLGENEAIRNDDDVGCLFDRAPASSIIVCNIPTVGIYVFTSSVNRKKNFFIKVPINM